MDDMHIPDVQIMTKYLEYAETSTWVQTRQIMLSVLKPYLKKKDITAEELFPLAIDKDKKAYQGHTTEMTNEELEWWHKYKEQYNKQYKDGI